MTIAEQVITVGMVVLGTIITRFLPFIDISCQQTNAEVYKIFLARYCPLR